MLFSGCSRFFLWFPIHPVFYQFFWDMIILFHLNFSHQHQQVVFHRSLSDSKSPKVSRTTADFTSTLGSLLLFYIPLNLFPRFLRTVSFMIDITVTFMFQNLFNSQTRSKYLSIFLLSFIFPLWSYGIEYLQDKVFSSCSLTQGQIF